ncbi:uncharacterized protein LOC131876269 [Cryptomeria japonica]|uniref:uncharacterized protein LOC131876269 n=1 Tax=Cryptomeria japonica TaxID=3369 RepID=UPI0027D9F3A4|nr:uncharacterized protein LOC131876269 [Cryptomeria japonica]
MKAYDRVDWEALGLVLLKLGFSEAWVKWINACISSTRFLVLINGSPCGFYSSSRGLRQGDPLSPFLFIVLAESFSWAIKAAKLKGLWKGIVILGFPISISHCLFADDTILFGQASLREANTINGIIQKYATFSRQKVNIEKSKIFFLNTSQLVQQRLQSFWSFEPSILPFPIYLMSVLKAPKSVIVSLQDTLRSFLWSSNKDGRHKLPLVAWDNVCLLKDLGSTDYFEVIHSGDLKMAKSKSIEFLDVEKDLKMHYAKVLGERMIILSESEDELVWTRNISGKYMVKDGYNSLMSVKDSSSWPYKLFWHSTCLSKAEAFSWFSIDDVQVSCKPFGEPTKSTTETQSALLELLLVTIRNTKLTQ